MIRLFIITYDRPKALDETLTTLFSTDFAHLPEKDRQVWIINNHPHFSLNDRYVDRVKVLHNQTRSPNSCGNLSENYNQALIWGFESLTSPACDQVVHIQDDCELDSFWYSNLRIMHKRYSFIVGSFGDNIVSYLPEAVRKVGLWDENFCGIQHKEADYWIRALIWNKDKSMIGDTMHNRGLNCDEMLPLDIVGCRNIKQVDGKLKRGQDDEHHAGIKRQAVKANEILRAYFYKKWFGTWKHELPRDLEGWLVNWPEEFVANPPKYPRWHLTPFRYPWFEVGIENLEGKGYVLP